MNRNFFNGYKDAWASRQRGELPVYGHDRNPSGTRRYDFTKILKPDELTGGFVSGAQLARYWDNRLNSNTLTDKDRGMYAAHGLCVLERAVNTVEAALPTRNTNVHGFAIFDDLPPALTLLEKTGQLGSKKVGKLLGRLTDAIVDTGQEFHQSALGNLLADHIRD